MIWAKVSSWSCLCSLYRASPSLAAKNIINLISVLTIWWYPRLASSLVLLEEDVCYDECVLLAKLFILLAFALLHFVLQGQICLLFQVSLHFLLLHSSPKDDEKNIFFGCSFWKVLYVIIKPFNFSFFSITGQGTDVDYCDIECLPWKRTEIILSFLHLHPSTAFWTLLLTMMATPCLLRDSCPQ